MKRVEKTVFISYRRTNVSWALAISQSLTHSGFDVFLDYQGIASGDFERSILENIRSRAHFLVVLTPSALEHCDDPGDWLRREIEEALRIRRNIVPLMLEGFDFGTPTIASKLTGKLAALKQYNGMTVLAEYFEAAMTKLREKFLNVPLDAVLHPASGFAQQVAKDQQTAAATVTPLGGLGASPAPGGKAMVSVFDGTRRLYQDAGELLITVSDGNQNLVSRNYHKTSSMAFTGFRVFGNLGDNYTFIASADGYMDAGFFPVKIAANAVQIVDLMLIPKSNQLNFAQAGWDAVRRNRPALAKLLAAGTENDDAASLRYGDLMETQGGAVLACLLNIATAMGQIQLPQKTALDYLKMIDWQLDGPYPMAQDRFFAWADPALISQLEQAKQRNEFADAPGALRPGATRSYKQIQFGEANVQLTFHENERRDIDGLHCVLVEPDIDYYRDPAAHLLLEVPVNAFGSLTDPRTVYVLRWIAGRHAGIPEFDPLYTIVKA